MRNVHDVMCAWTFDIDPDKKPFTEGTIKMDRDDFQTALGMVYDTFGWDHEKGCPTAACLDQYGMADVKEDWTAGSAAVEQSSAGPQPLRGFRPPYQNAPGCSIRRSRLSGKGGRRIRRQPTLRPSSTPLSWISKNSARRSCRGRSGSCRGRLRQALRGRPLGERDNRR